MVIIVLSGTDDLVNLGVPRSDIILGLQSLYQSPYTNYGLA